jgi:hypothetical protein
MVAHRLDVARTSRRCGIGSRDSRDARPPRSRLRRGRTLKRRIPRVEELFFAHKGKRKVLRKMVPKKAKSWACLIVPAIQGEIPKISLEPRPGTKRMTGASATIITATDTVCPFISPPERSKERTITGRSTQGSTGEKWQERWFTKGQSDARFDGRDIDHSDLG